MQSVVKILFLWGVILVLFAFTVGTGGVRGYSYEKEYAEAFQNLAPSSKEEWGELPDTANSPENADLKDVRKPYHLLNGVLLNAAADNKLNYELNSCACYGGDYESKIQLVGNYTQTTNNYKRATPDTCSAPFRELVNNFYEAKA